LKPTKAPLAALPAVQPWTNASAPGVGVAYGLIFTCINPAWSAIDFIQHNAACGALQGLGGIIFTISLPSGATVDIST
jgi:hypothetical protein